MAVDAKLIETLYAVIESRRGADPDESYVARTLAGGTAKVAQKLGEEAVETVVAAGGVGALDHLVEGVRDGHASAVLAASIFHFGTHSIAEARAHMRAAGIPVRP